MPTSPRKLLVVSGVRGDTRRYRAFHLYQQLRLCGAEVILSDITNPAVLGFAADCILLVLHRTPWDATVHRLVEQVRANGGVVLYDTDDLVFDPAAFDWIDSPDFADPIRARLYREQLAGQRRTLEATDGALVSTTYLAKVVRRLGKPAWVHRNAFSLEMAELSEQACTRRQPVQPLLWVGYASGTLTHNRDFALIRPALEALLGRCPQAGLTLIGALDDGGNWGVLAGRVQRIPLVPWRKLPAVLAALAINLAPLVVDNPFAQSKSEIKYVEAALVGVPTVASPTAAFREAIRPGQNGDLAGSPAEWEQILVNLVENPARCYELGKAARADALARYSPQVRASELRRLLAEIASHLGRPELESLAGSPGEAIASPPDPRAYFIPSHHEQHPTRIEQGLYLLRQGELRRLMGMIWVQIRRLLAPVWPFRREEE